MPRCYTQAMTRKLASAFPVGCDFRFPPWLALAFSLLLSLLLGACVPQAVKEPEQAQPPLDPSEVELTLNLPDENGDCDCPALPDQDHTFLERGVRALTAGDHIEAVQYFQRYQRLEQGALPQWESRIAIAYASMLPDSAFYDVDAAISSYEVLQQDEPEGQKHYSIVLMQQALETFLLMQRHVEGLESRTAILEDDLAKREQALKRLRELTLGQPGG